MKINGYEIVVSALSDNLNSQKAVGRMAHILREARQTKKLKYLRGSAKDNKYFIQNNFGVLQELSYSGNLTHQGIKGMINKQLLKFKGDYENQYITDKNGKSKKRAWQKKMTPFTEVLIVFGTQRPKEKKEGLNKEESDFINGLEITHNVMTLFSLTSGSKNTRLKKSSMQRLSFKSRIFCPSVDKFVALHARVKADVRLRKKVFETRHLFFHPRAIAHVAIN